MFLTNEYFNFGGLMMQEIGEKLGDRVYRPKNMYYVRFLMMLANHVDDKLVITNQPAKLESWVQEKRIFMELLRMNLYPDVEVNYQPIMEPGNEGKIFGFPSTLAQPPTSLFSATMDSGKDPQHPSQVAQPSKSKTKKPTSGASQKAPVVKTKKHKPDRSVKGVSEGEGKGENQQNPKDKAGELCVNHPIHSVVSKKTSLQKDYRC